MAVRKNLLPEFLKIPAMLLLEYCASLGEIYDIVVEDMDRQSRGLKG